MYSVYIVYNVHQITVYSMYIVYNVHQSTLYSVYIVYNVHQRVMNNVLSNVLNMKYCLFTCRNINWPGYET